jgi:hypothetical protein
MKKGAGEWGLGCELRVRSETRNAGSSGIYAPAVIAVRKAGCGPETVVRTAP